MIFCFRTRRRAVGQLLSLQKKKKKFLNTHRFWINLINFIHTPIRQVYYLPLYAYKNYIIYVLIIARVARRYVHLNANIRGALELRTKTCPRPIIMVWVRYIKRNIILYCTALLVEKAVIAKIEVMSYSSTLTHSQIVA